MRRAWTLVLVFLFLSPTALAQGGKQLWAGAGLALPMGEFGDVAKSGPQFGGGFGFELSPAFTLGGEIIYNMYALADLVQAEADANGVDMDVRLTQMTLVARVDLMPTPSTVYAKFTGGIYRGKVSASEGDFALSMNNSDFGFGFGLGYQIFGAGNTGGFIEGLYHHIPGSDEKFGDFTIEGAATEYFDLRGGIVFNFPTSTGG